MLYMLGYDFATFAVDLCFSEKTSKSSIERTLLAYHFNTLFNTFFYQHVFVIYKFEIQLNMGDTNEATAGKIFIDFFVLISFRKLK